MSASAHIARKPGMILLHLAPLLIALALRLIYLHGLSHTSGYRVPVVDAAYHEAWAHAIAFDNWQFSPRHDVSAIRHAPFFRPPGYPYFLALVYRLGGTTPVWPRLANIALSLAAIALLGAIARRLCGSRAAWWAQLAAACYWGLIYFDGEILEVSLITFAAAATLYGLIRAAAAATTGGAVAWAAAAGLALGLHAISRPNILAAAPFLALWLLLAIRRYACRSLPRALLPTAALTLGALLVILPVTIRNRLAGGEWVLISANGGINLHIGNNDNADGLFVGSTTEFGSFGTSSLYEEVLQGLAEAQGRPFTYRQADQYFAAIARHWIATHPGRALRLAGRKLVYLCSARETGHNRVIYCERRFLPLLPWLPGNWALLLSLTAAAFTANFLDRRHAHPRKHQSLIALRLYSWPSAYCLLLITFFLLYSASFIPFFVTGQYRMPLALWLCLGAGCAIDSLTTILAARQWRRALAALAIGAIVYAGSAINWLHFTPNLAKWHFDEGTSLEALGNYPAARNAYNAAIAAGGQTGKAWYNLGRLEAAAGRLSAAEAAYRAAIQAGLPSRSDAWNNLGNLLLRQGRAPEAAAALAEAVRLNPRHKRARHNYGVALIATGRPAEGQAQIEAARAMP